MPRSLHRGPPPRRELELDVVLSAINGSAAAFERLFDHYQALVRYAVARGALAARYHGDVEDIVQEVWCWLLRSDRHLLSYFDPERGPFTPFIGRLAYQQTLAAIHRCRRQLPDVGLYGQGDELEDQWTSSFAARLIQSDFYDKLIRRANAELDESERLLLREVHLNQRSCRAVAEELGLKYNALYKRNQRLKEKLATMAGELLGANGPHASGPLVLILMIVGAALMGPATASHDGATASDTMRDECPWR